MGFQKKTMVFLAVIFVCGMIAATGARAQILTDADLNGRYIVSQLIAGETLIYALEFDGAGVLTDLALLNASFKVNGEDIDPDTAAQIIIGIPESTLYSVQPDGSFFFSGSSMAGALSSNGQIISFVQTDKGGLPQINIGIRAASGISDTALVGDYFIHVFEFDIGNTVNELEANSYIIDASFDAMGQMSGELIAGSIVDADPIFRAGYRVEETGLLFIEREGEGSPDTGAVSADGSVFAAVDTNWAEGEDIRIMIGVKAADEDELTHQLFLSEYFFTELLVAGSTPTSVGQFVDIFGQMNFDGFSGFQRRQLFGTISPLESTIGTVRILTDGLFVADGLTGTIVPDGSFFAATRIEPGLAGLRIGIANSTFIGSERRLLNVEPVDHDAVCFIRAVKK